MLDHDSPKVDFEGAEMTGRPLKIPAAISGGLLLP
jgi:hypothetical protein